MNLRIAILEVLRDADVRGATFAVLTPHVQGQCIGETWTRNEIERELIKLMDEGFAASIVDKLQQTNRYYITTKGQVALAR